MLWPAEERVEMVVVDCGYFSSSTGSGSKVVGMRLVKLWVECRDREKERSPSPNRRIEEEVDTGRGLGTGVEGVSEVGVIFPVVMSSSIGPSVVTISSPIGISSSSKTSPSPACFGASCCGWFRTGSGLCCCCFCFCFRSCSWFWFLLCFWPGIERPFLPIPRACLAIFNALPIAVGRASSGGCRVANIGWRWVPQLDWRNIVRRALPRFQVYTKYSSRRRILKTYSYICWILDLLANHRRNIRRMPE